MDWARAYMSFFCVLWLCMVSGGRGFNITTFLWKHSEFTTFNSLLTATNVAGEIGNRSSLTILALSNAQLEQFISSFHGNLPTQEISDVLRYHVLLEYWGWDRLQHVNPVGTLVTTLYQTTGRAPNNTGAVNITSVDGQVRIGMPVAAAGYNATVSGTVGDFPYVINIVRVSNMIFPVGFDFSGYPSPSPVGINVTDVLVKAKNFTFLVSLMEASGVVSEFQSDEAGAGITIFAPTDDAFSALKPETLQGLTADKKALILKYHVLLSYYPLGTLQTIVNPVQPTLATQDMGASSYTLNITSIQGKVIVNTGVVHAPVKETVFDEKPLAVFAVTKVLLPKEIFGVKNAPAPRMTAPTMPPELPVFRSPASAPSPAYTPVRAPVYFSPPIPAPARQPELPPFRSPASAPSPAYTPVQAPVYVSPPIPAPALQPELPPFRSPVSAPSPYYEPVQTPVYPSPPSVAPTTVPYAAPSSAPMLPRHLPLSPTPSPISVIVSPAPAVFATSPALSPNISLSPTPASVEMLPPLTPLSSLSPSPSPFVAGVGKISSGAPASSVLRTGVMGFGWVLAVVLLLEKV